MNMKPIYNLLGTIVLAGVFSACQENVSISLQKNQPDKVVVEGRITDVAKEQIIRLTKTSDYFDTLNIQSASINDVFIVEEGTGNRIDLQPVDTGIGYYKTNVYAGKIGETYSLHLTYKDENYSASSKLTKVAEMDTLSYLFQAKTKYQGGIYIVMMSATEPEPIGDIYMFNIYINDTLYNDKLRLTPFQNDDPFNGMTVINVPIAYLAQEEIKLDTNVIRVEMLSISRDEFNFNLAFLSETMGNGSIFSGPPADVPSNLKNMDSDNNGLGFFGASAVVAKEMTLIKQHNDSTNNPDYRK
jgi:hypothetical protein